MHTGNPRDSLLAPAFVRPSGGPLAHLWRPPFRVGRSIRISKFKSYPRRARGLLSVSSPPAIWHDQCFTSTRRGRSLIKLLKDFRRRPKRGPALRFVDSGRGFSRFHCAFSVLAASSTLFFPSCLLHALSLFFHKDRERKTTFSVSPLSMGARVAAGRDKDRLSGNWIHRLESTGSLSDYT